MTLDRVPDVFPTLEAGDFTLRRIDHADAADWYRYLSDTEVTALTSVEFRSQADVDALVNYFLDAFRAKTAMRWAISPRDTNVMMGDCGYNMLDDRNSSGVIGYLLAKEYWGHGIMTTALNEILRYGFHQFGLNRVEATIHPDDRRSARLLEKLGFRLEGRLRDYRRARGAFRDCLIFGLLKREWTDPS